MDSDGSEWISLGLLLVSVVTFAVTFADLCSASQVLRLSLYFLLVSAIGVGASAYWTWENRSAIRRRSQSFRWTRFHGLFISLLALAAAARFWHLGYPSIWLDEDIQAHNASGVMDLVYTAATQQQPPLDYFFENLALNVFGYQPWAARLSSALFGTMIPTVLAGLVYRISKNIKWALFASCLAALNPWLIAYSQEGRPYSCSLFFLSIYLLVSHAALVEDFSWAAFLGVATSAFMYLSSVGFQPPIMLFCICTTSLLFGHFWNGRRVLLLNGATFLGLILFLPLQFQISSFSQVFLKNRGNFSLADISNYLRDFNYGIFFGFFNAPPSSFFAQYFLVPCVALALVLGIISKVRKSDWFYLCFFVFSSTLFLFLSISAYHVLVAWTAQPQIRYVLAILPLWLVGFVLALHFLSQRLNAKAIVVFGGMILTASAVQLPHAYMGKLDNWQALFEFLKDDAEKPALAAMLSIHKLGKWSPKGVAGVDFYAKTVSPNVEVFNNWDQDKESQADFLSQAVGPEHVNSDLYLVLYDAGDAVPANPYHRFAETYPDFAQVHDVARLSVLTIRNKSNLRNTLRETLGKFESLFGETDLNRNVFETFTRLALKDSNCAMAKVYMGKLDRVTVGEVEYQFTYRILGQRVRMACGAY